MHCVNAFKDCNSLPCHMAGADWAPEKRCWEERFGRGFPRTTGPVRNVTECRAPDSVPGRQLADNTEVIIGEFYSDSVWSDGERAGSSEAECELDPPCCACCCKRAR